jgi:hypothetical protein
MSRICKGIGAGKMWGCNADDRLVTTDAMNLVHCVDEILEMFDNIIGQHLPEMIIRKWPGQLIEIVNDIRICISRHVQIDRLKQMLATASEIKNLALTEFLCADSVKDVSNIGASDEKSLTKSQPRGIQAGPHISAERLAEN